MNHRAYLCIIFGLFSLFPDVFGQKGPSANTTNSVIIVIQGTVEVAPAGTENWKQAQLNQEIKPGERLRTGARSRAELRLANLSILPVNELATINFEAPKAASSRPILNLERSSLFMQSKDKPSENTFRTRYASGAIRGTEFHLEVADDGTTVASLLEGELTLSNALGSVTLQSGEQGIVQPDQAPRKTALINAERIIQWCLYYPAVLNPADLGLEGNVKLARSLEHYSKGNLLRALEALPADGELMADEEKIYRAALLLAVGRVNLAEPVLTEMRSKAGAVGRTADALGQLIATVKGKTLARDRAPELATEWLAESYARQANSDLGGALEAAAQAVGKAPDFGFAQERVAELEFSFGRTGKANEALNRALRMSPQNAQALSLKGFLLAADNKVTQAREAFDAAIAADGMLGEAWLGRGLCRIKLGDDEGGRQDLQVAAATEPLRSSMRSYLGKALSNSGKVQEARKELQLAAKLDPGDPTPPLYAALLDQQENRINSAVRALEKSQDLNQNRSIFRSSLLLDQDRAVRSANLAAIYQDAGMEEVSVREAGRAVAADYGNYSAHLFLANSYDALRDPRQVNLRYETPWLNEYLLANLLAPVGAGMLSQAISQQEYSKLFERDGFGMSSRTEYLSRGSWIEDAAQFGTFRHSAWSIESFYSTDPGERKNNDFEQLSLSVKLKQELSVHDTAYLQASYYDANGGDLSQYYDRRRASQTLRGKENQEPLLMAGYHHEWAPGVHTLVLFNRLDDTVHTTNSLQPNILLAYDASGNFVTNAFANASARYRSALEIYSGELQQIMQTEGHTTVFGARYQAGNFVTESDLSAFGLRPNSSVLGSGPTSYRERNDFERYNAYAYHSWQIWKPLQLTAGVSYDQILTPLNFRLPPLSSREDRRDQFSPKGGFVWQPLSNTVVRGAYSRSLGGVSFDQSFQLEPSQIAGINQLYRSLIPESIEGAAAAPQFETWGISVEQRWGRGTYVGLRGDILNSKVEREIGAFTLDNSTFTFLPSQAEQRLTYRERSITLSGDQLVGEEWSVGARLRISDANLHDRLENTPFDGETRGVLEQAYGHVLYNHRSGFFGQFQSIWTRQSNFGYAPDQPGDDFWQFNVFAGYRFAHRRAEARIGLLNLTGQDYQLNPLTFYLELPHRRTFFASLKIRF